MIDERNDQLADSVAPDGATESKKRVSPSKSAAYISVVGLTKTYKTDTGLEVEAVSGIDLEVAEGAVFTLVGPSGCGKSTTLRCIAGLETPDSGRITIGGDIVFDSADGTYVGPEHRKIGMVFQSYAIWPHMTVIENVEFPLTIGPRRERKSPALRRKAAMEALGIMGMADLATRSSTELSGGQQQRLALARAIVSEPKCLLLDEPLSNLDAKLRERMRFELQKLQNELGVTTVYVTHDQAEALALSDRIAVMNAGEVSQIGSPEEIYGAPATSFVADFVGSANMLRGRVDELPDEDVGLGSVALLGRADPVRARFMGGFERDSEVTVSVRPELIKLHSQGDPIDESDWTLQGVIASRVYLGQATEFLIETDLAELRVRLLRGSGFKVGDRVVVSVRPTDCLAVDVDVISELPRSDIAESSNDSHAGK